MNGRLPSRTSALTAPISQRALLDGLEILLVAEVDGERDDVVAALLLQPADGDGRIETAGVGEDDLLGHGAGPHAPVAGAARRMRSYGRLLLCT